MKRRAQQGVILMSALILVALAAIVAAALFFETGMSARRAAASFSMEQALQLGQGAEALAAYALAEDKNQQDTPAESWAQPYGPVEVAPEVGLEALVSDEQGRFNLNTLVDSTGARDPKSLRVFERLLELKDIEPRWAALVVDLIDPNTVPESEGGEDGLYLSRQPPHRAGNLPLTSISELLQLPGFTRELYERLAPHVTALPPSASTVNVCMADGVVLDALYALSQTNPVHVEYSLLTPEQLAERRRSGCFPQRSVLTANEPDMQARTAERTAWLRLRTWIRIGTAQFALYSLLHRDGSGQVRPVARSFGTE